MRTKNEILPKLQEKFEAALHEGKILGFKELTVGDDWLASLVRELDA